MPRYKVLAIVGHEEMRLELRTRTARMENIALVGFASIDADIMTKIKGYAPHVVLLVQDEGDSGILEIAQRIYQGFPGCAMVLMTPRPDIPLLKNAMQSGIREVIDFQNIDNLEDTLIQAALLEQGRSVEVGSDPRVVTVYSGRGGTGKTTIAVNLAVSLALLGRRTALIDLCLNFGDASMLMNINAKDTISELVQEKNAFTIDDIKSFCMQHVSGVSVLCAPGSPENGEYVTSRHVESLINQMRPYYDFILLDLPCDLSDCTLSTFENADDIILVSRKDISNLRASKQVMEVLTTLQQQEKVKFILNADHKSIINKKDFEKILGIPVDYVLPEDQKSAQICLERGMPFVMELPRTAIAREVRKIARSWIDKSNRRDGK